jgi:hypothetical protein
MMKSSLQVRSKCQRELEEDLIPAIAAIEHAQFIDPQDRRPMVNVSAIDPLRTPRLANLSRTENSLKGADPSLKQYERIQEVYENNQNIYLQRFEQGQLSEAEMVEKICHLESWMVSFFEPPPLNAPPSCSGESEELDQWLERILFRKNHGKNKDTPEDIEPYLDPSKLQISLKKRTENYFKADKIYRQLKTGHTP